jgi:hypothetical protein
MKIAVPGGVATGIGSNDIGSSEHSGGKLGITDDDGGAVIALSRANLTVPSQELFKRRQRSPANRTIRKIVGKFVGSIIAVERRRPRKRSGLATGLGFGLAPAFGFGFGFALALGVAFAFAKNGYLTTRTRGS